MNRTSHFRRRLTVAGASAALGLALVPTAAAPVAAATSVESGWWTSVPVPAPDADGELLVQGGLAEPAAFAAVGYELEADEDVTGLVLTVTDGSATTPGSTLRACPLTQGFQSGSGQPMEEAPAYDCALEVTAEVSDDGTTYSFDLTSLQGAEALGVAVLPSVPTDRVVLQSPGPDAVESTGASADSPSGSPGPFDTFGGPTPPSETAPPSDAGSTGGGLTLRPATPSVSPGAPPEAAPVADDASTETGPTEQAASTGPALQAPPAVAAAASNGGPIPLLGAMLLAGLTATLWLRAGRGETTPLVEPG